MSRRHPKKLSSDLRRLRIEALNCDGRGVGHVEGRAVLVDEALPDELVAFTYVKAHRRFDEARLHEVIERSPDRVAPRCEHFGVCGGCSLQHMAPGAQIVAKQGMLLEQLRDIGNVVPEEVAAPLQGPRWGYRRRARLGVKYVTKKQRVLVGFRERRSAYLADVKRCEVLLPEVGTCLQELAGLVASLDTYHHVPQIEVAAGDDAVALVFRHLQALSEADEAKLAAFARARGFHAYSQSGGPATLRPLGGGHDEMCYRLHAFGVELCFVPTDFTQINAEINRQMVGQAIDWLAPAPHERILDLFCGIGNFTLPIARHGSSVVGVEGERTLVERARRNAAHNAIDNVMFFATDLATELGSEPWAQESFDKAVLDPPRSGAGEVLAVLSGLNVGRIVYVSCNGATLARDAGVLVNDLEYRLSRLGVVDMFPHTTHMEAMALFERPRA